MSHRRNRTRRFDGGGLGLRLFALVLVPVLGLTALSADKIAVKVSSLQAARDVQALVREVTLIDATRSAVIVEMTPAIALSYMSSPAVLQAIGLTASEVASVGISQSAVAGLRRRTDAAVASAERVPALARSFRAWQPSIAQMRREASSAADGTQAYATAGAVVGALTATENSLIRKATAHQLDSAVSLALSDLIRVARAAQAASQELPYFAGSVVVAPGTSPEDARVEWLTRWGAARSAAATVLADSDPAIATAWRAAALTPSWVDFDRTVFASIGSPLGLGTHPVTAVMAALAPNPAREDALSAVLDLAGKRIIDAAQRQRNSSVNSLVWTSVLMLLLVLSSAGCALVARGSLTRPLRRLAEQAGRVSEGVLPDVTVAGPREVRTVGRGLAAAVASLRRIQDQAHAVASGDLHSDVVRQPLPGPLGEVVHDSVGAIVDAIEAREKAQDDLAHRAAHDALTELPNRAQALNLIEGALHRAQRSGSVTGLMFVDLDHFKSVNDTLGHAAGDLVLQTAAQRMVAAVRDGDMVARLGGDEFVVLLENVDTEANFVRLAERIVDALCEPIRASGRHVKIGASVGVALCSDGDVDAGRLLRDADAAAYQAKNAGRGRVGIFDEDLRESLRLRTELEDAIANALVADEFLLHYQPVVDLHSGRTLGVEALIRWNRPGHGMIGPDGFIPIAEGSTLINDIGRWALHEATRQVVAWAAQDELAVGLTVAVNISGRHLTSRQLVTDVRDAVAASGIDPTQLVIELTETILVDDPLATVTMESLREMGVRIAIDDFGTGYTSIGQLPKLPVDTIKIDRSFVGSPDPAHRELVRLIVTAAHAFGLTVVAEGVEHGHQADALRAADVRTGQGFFFARPEAAEYFDPSRISGGLVDSRE